MSPQTQRVFKYLSDHKMVVTGKRPKRHLEKRLTLRDLVLTSTEVKEETGRNKSAAAGQVEKLVPAATDNSVEET